MFDTVQEIAIYIHRFHNLDLFQQGWYQIKISMRWEDDDYSSYGTPWVVQYESPAALAIAVMHPRMIAIHDLDSQGGDGPQIPVALPLSSEHVNEDGVYLLENGQDGLIYIGSSVDPDILHQLFGITSVAEIPAQFVLQQYDNPQSKNLNKVVNEIRRQRCSYLRLRLCKKGDPSGSLFFSHLIEDKVPTGGLSYVEFLVHVHRQIQMKISS